MNRKIVATLVGGVVLIIAVIIAVWNGKDKGVGLMELSKNLDYKDSEQMLNELPGKIIYISDGKIIINDKNTKIDSSEVIEKSKQVAINEVDVNGKKLVIRCSNGKEIPIVDLTDSEKKSVKRAMRVDNKTSNEEESKGQEKHSDDEDNKQDKSDDSEKGINKEQEKNILDKESTDNYEDEYVDSCELVVGKKEASVGDNVEIPIVIKKNPGILGMTISIEYDDEALELEDIKNGEAYANILRFTKPKILENGCICLWDAVNIEKDDIKDGVIAMLVFNVRSNAKKQTYSVDVECSGNDAVNDNLESIEVIVKSGHIKVKE